MEEMKTRAEGYYWVKYFNEWTIGHYSFDKTGKWALPSNFNDRWWLEDSDLTEIDERRIEREPEPAAHKLGYTPDQL